MGIAKGVGASLAGYAIGKMLPSYVPTTKESHPVKCLQATPSFFIAYTLVDITDSGNSDPKIVVLHLDKHKSNSPQALSLRTQLVLSSVDVKLPQDLSDYDFGSDFTGSLSRYGFINLLVKQMIYSKGEMTLFSPRDDVHGALLYRVR